MPGKPSTESDKAGTKAPNSFYTLPPQPVPLLATMTADTKTSQTKTLARDTAAQQTISGPNNRLVENAAGGTDAPMIGYAIVKTVSRTLLFTLVALAVKALILPPVQAGETPLRDFSGFHSSKDPLIAKGWPTMGADKRHKESITKLNNDIKEWIKGRLEGDHRLLPPEKDYPLQKLAIMDINTGAVIPLLGSKAEGELILGHPSASSELPFSPVFLESLKVRFRLGANWNYVLLNALNEVTHLLPPIDQPLEKHPASSKELHKGYFLSLGMLSARANIEFLGLTNVAEKNAPIFIINPANRGQEKVSHLPAGLIQQLQTLDRGQSGQLALVTATRSPEGESTFSRVLMPIDALTTDSPFVSQKGSIALATTWPAKQLLTTEVDKAQQGMIRADFMPRRNLKDYLSSTPPDAYHRLDLAIGIDAESGEKLFHRIGSLPKPADWDSREENGLKLIPKKEINVTARQLLQFASSPRFASQAFFIIEHYTNKGISNVYRLSRYNIEKQLTVLFDKDSETIETLTEDPAVLANADLESYPYAIYKLPSANGDRLDSNRIVSDDTLNNDLPPIEETEQPPATKRKAVKTAQPDKTVKVTPETTRTTEAENIVTETGKTGKQTAQADSQKDLWLSEDEIDIQSTKDQHNSKKPKKTADTAPLPRRSERLKNSMTMDELLAQNPSLAIDNANRLQQLDPEALQRAFGAILDNADKLVALKPAEKGKPVDILTAQKHQKEKDKAMVNLQKQLPPILSEQLSAAIANRSGKGAGLPSSGSSTSGKIKSPDQPFKQKPKKPEPDKKPVDPHNLRVSGGKGSKKSAGMMDHNADNLRDKLRALEEAEARQQAAEAERTPFDMEPESEPDTSDRTNPISDQTMSTLRPFIEISPFGHAMNWLKGRLVNHPFHSIGTAVLLVSGLNLYRYWTQLPGPRDLLLRKTLEAMGASATPFHQQALEQLINGTPEHLLAHWSSDSLSAWVFQACQSWCNRNQCSSQRIPDPFLNYVLSPVSTDPQKFAQEIRLRVSEEMILDERDPWLRTINRRRQGLPTALDFNPVTRQDWVAELDETGLLVQADSEHQLQQLPVKIMRRGFLETAITKPAYQRNKELFPGQRVVDVTNQYRPVVMYPNERHRFGVFTCVSVDGDTWRAIDISDQESGLYGIPALMAFSQQASDGTCLPAGMDKWLVILSETGMTHTLRPGHNLNQPLQLNLKAVFAGAIEKLDLKQCQLQHWQRGQWLTLNFKESLPGIISAMAPENALQRIRCNNKTALFTIDALTGAPYLWSWPAIPLEAIQ